MVKDCSPVAWCRAVSVVEKGFALTLSIDLLSGQKRPDISAEKYKM